MAGATGILGAVDQAGGRAIEDGWRRGTLRLLGPVFHGGDAGRRQLVLMVYAIVVPLATAEAYLLGHLRPALLGFRLLVAVSVFAWLLRRQRATTVEWLVFGIVFPLTANLATQMAVGADLNILFVLNIVIVVALLALVFEAGLLTVGAALATAGFALMQNHFHGARVAAVSAAALGIGLALEVVLINGTARLLRDSLRSLEGLSAEREQLHDQMQAAADEERRRIAGALHDDTVQVMTAAGMQVDALRRQLGPGQVDAARAAAEAAGTIQSAIDRVRRLSFDLHPPALELLGLGPALEMLAEQASTQSRLAVEVDATEERASGDAERLAYRTIKELLANAQKHADASRVSVTVIRLDTGLRCEVADDGRGFTETLLTQARNDRHLGLDSAAERVRLAGGTFSIESRRGRGTRVRFTVPADCAVP
jgi:signal transduction histidine kinase